MNQTHLIPTSDHGWKCTAYSNSTVAPKSVVSSDGTLFCVTQLLSARRVKPKWAYELLVAPINTPTEQERLLFSPESDGHGNLIVRPT